MKHELEASALREFLQREALTFSQSCINWINSDQFKIFDDFLRRLAILLVTRTNKVVFFGNGGSAAESSHLAAEFVSKCVKDTGAKPAISLTDNLAVITAISNDFGYQNVFVRQVEALCTAGDVVVGMSTSGSSVSVLEALKRAKALGCKTSLWTSEQFSKIEDLEVDWLIVAPTLSTPRAQEFHLFLGHAISEYLERQSGSE